MEILRQKNPALAMRLSTEPVMTPKEWAKSKVDSLNATTGDLDNDDGYNCTVCRNKGWVAKLDDSDGDLREVFADCKCMPIRNSIRRMQRSGLQAVIRECTFEKWIATEEWQKAVKAAAMEYAKAPQGWFFIGGQPGCGKTHLCTAICRELLLRGKEVRYMQWREDAVKLKGLSKEPDQRQTMVDEFKKTEVLYIDDLFKTGRNQDGTEQRPTSADINLAFEILNFRYNNPDSITIISSELCADDLNAIDQGLGSRICDWKRTKVIKISRDISRNYRLRNQLTF